MNGRAGDNPFRTSRLLALASGEGEASAVEAAQAAAEDGALLARWHAAGRRGALVGPRGTGKTTRLRALAARLAATEGWRVCWVHWHDDGTTTPEYWRAGWGSVAAARTLLCLDGSENLGWLARRRLRAWVRSAGIGGVLATLHRPSGWLPTLAKHVPDAARFARDARRLAPELSEERARAVFATAGANAHEAFRRLYLEWRPASRAPLPEVSGETPDTARGTRALPGPAEI